MDNWTIRDLIRKVEQAEQAMKIGYEVIAQAGYCKLCAQRPAIRQGLGNYDIAKELLEEIKAELRGAL